MLSISDKIFDNKNFQSMIKEDMLSRKDIFKHEHATRNIFIRKQDINSSVRPLPFELSLLSLSFQLCFHLMTIIKLENQFSSIVSKHVDNYLYVIFKFNFKPSDCDFITNQFCYSKKFFISYEFPLRLMKCRWMPMLFYQPCL